MPKLTVSGLDTFEVETGKKLVLALEDNGVDILHRCGGKARCTTCRVEILEGNFDDLTNIEKKAFDEKGLVDDHIRLSCQVRVNGEMTVRPIMTVQNSGMDPGPRPAE
ncbi:(2Fe-2S)-binding protein [Domibacillus sp. A3M-37]|jgi:ferredoxin|uniref:2Fe-2S iron-sulfur cluster-binding protein n=1 Tax=Domibacillus TaxID=1433999 RepID=UPI000617B23E|nr:MULTISPECIES: 2Fe-2S iron-sulfur cluster-binding protein [Domibacillus]MCP3762887.1 (2Fe-2S)-binding protein [Domibacillus sp. A3M-37]